MSARRRPGDYPDLRIADISGGGSLFLWRNPAGRRFGEQDAWTLSADWTHPSDLPSAYAVLKDEESRLAARNAFAWNADFGYLSPDPEHCGIALSAEGEFHLEALNLIGDLPPVLNALEAVRFRTASVLEDGIRQAAHIFRVHTAATLGISEEDLLARARRVFEDLIAQELNARHALVEDTPRVLLDALSRALAVLRSARLIAPGELLDLLSPIRLAASMGFLTGITRAEILKLMRKQLNTPELPPSQTTEDDRRRDDRDAHLADFANARFADVALSPLAETYLG